MREQEKRELSWETRNVSNEVTNDQVDSNNNNLGESNMIMEKVINDP